MKYNWSTFLVNETYLFHHTDTVGGIIIEDGPSSSCLGGEVGMLHPNTENSEETCSSKLK